MTEYDHTKHLTDAALAARLRSMADYPNSWRMSERQAHMHEAARRLELKDGLQEVPEVQPGL